MFFRSCRSCSKESLTYKTERIWTTGHIVGNSRISASREFPGVNLIQSILGHRNVVSNYDFKYPESENWHKFTQPLELSYESINVENGKKMLLGKLKFLGGW